MVSHANRVQLGQDADVTRLFLGCGTIDIFTGGRTAAQLIADRLTIASYFPNAKVFDGTITPATSSTDSWSAAN
ncbi:hypothetical protein PMI42_01374 [Bradyrhizobium sp. YR681]|uniref:hypothetical protein n=1 Tax=Bradyrhizobium sp. YR681 TaxID=1144344 RepID=UPI000270E6D2|nr:hypothetical protein [Bradyrhizobium sp. YR681]EJN15076.1 hypothetical protein PMI42_01374 [Bradyrhizobium sp. YR681]